ncbi:MAG: energy-dependent translational throttle protein EttA [Proteobacteria bacterium]|nr:energy-dependent translational throttle protein EttA [Pseudomonadota bacterium]
MSDAGQKIIYSMVRVAKTHRSTGKQVLRDISLSYFYGAKIGVLGLNGSGKSTLLRIMAGVDKEFAGEAHLTEGYSVGFLPQEPELDGTKTVKEIVQEGCAEVVALLKEFEDINAKLGDENLDPDDMEKLCNRQAEVQDKLDAHDAWSLDDKLNFAMDAMRCPPPDQLVNELSGGERRRVALTRLLLQEPDILLLDEPTNHLDAESVAWLEKHLQEYKGTVIAVTHDRYFLDNVAGWILELDRGHGIPWKGNYSSWLEQKQKRLANEEKAEDKRRKTLERELEWIRMSPKARQAKSKARITAYENLANQEHDKTQDDMRLFIPPGPRLGDVVIRFEGVGKAYDDKLLYEGLNFDLPRGGIVGVIGPNGAGKTTLFRMITGQEEPTNGKLTIGETVKLGYMEQSRLALDSKKSVYDVISGGNEVVKLGKREVNGRTFAGRFNFTGTDQQKSVSELSGGERNRVQLALLIREEANVILLDEPTNDLDINTLRALEEALGDFPGCAVVISHDRWFLDRIATHILAFEGDSKITLFEGGYSDYEKNRRERLGREADTPHRIRYAKLKR